MTHTKRVYLQWRLRTLHSEDKLFASLGILNKLGRLKKDEKKLPKHDSFNRLDRLAGRIGSRSTNSNPFQIDNYLYRSRLKGKRIKAMKNRQVKLDYRRSPEYADFELILNQFAQSHTNVLFIMPPINAKWAKYTGLSMRMLKQTNRKIKQQLTSQGFNNVLDLTQAGNVNYFMQDTIHLGWRGWLAIDQVVRPFIERQQKSPHYQMKQMYFSKKWQQKIVK
nr:D-alanyl-lipoteichoic acid biosynthesis protein DltD [Secundilactobacillus pentosiphilus]